MVFRVLIVWAVVGLLLSGCSTTATVDSLTEMTSSSTGESWWTRDGLVKQGQHAELFVALNHENLLQDIAKGQGEYLYAFGHILNVPSSHQKIFATQLQRNFHNLSGINVEQGGTQLAIFVDHVVFVTQKSYSRS